MGVSGAWRGRIRGVTCACPGRDVGVSEGVTWACPRRDVGVSGA